MKDKMSEIEERLSVLEETIANIEKIYVTMSYFDNKVESYKRDIKTEIEELIYDKINSLSNRYNEEFKYTKHKFNEINIINPNNEVEVMRPEGDSFKDLFKNNTDIISIDLSFIDTSHITDMSYMFFSLVDDYQSQLSSINLNYINTSNVTNMESMFSGCLQLTSLDLSYFNTENVTNMGYMFYGCKNLNTIDLSHFNTSNVTIMEAMFSGCIQLTSLDLSYFNTNNVTDMEWMFYGCKNLETIIFKGDINNIKNLTSELPDNTRIYKN